MDVPKKIMEHVDRYDIPYTRLATVANVSSAAITKWFKGDYQLSFPHILALVKHFFPDEELELMGEYSLTLKNKNARLALEYCSINHLSQYYNRLLDCCVREIEKT